MGFTVDTVLFGCCLSSCWVCYLGTMDWMWNSHHRQVTKATTCSTQADTLHNCQYQYLLGFWVRSLASTFSQVPYYLRKTVDSVTMLYAETGYSFTSNHRWDPRTQLMQTSSRMRVPIFK